MKRIIITRVDGITCVECVDEELSLITGETELVDLIEGLGMLELAKHDLLQAHGVCWAHVVRNCTVCKPPMREIRTELYTDPWQDAVTGTRGVEATTAEVREI